MRKLPHSFFDRPAPEVAHDLIGCFLVRKRGKKTGRYLITETEAYDGFKDRASHAFRGKTSRNEILFRSAGHIYTYFTYGMHWMLGLVAGPVGHPAAVLIRGVIGDNGKTILNGPAKLTKYLGINGKLNGRMLSLETGLWIESGKNFIAPRLIKKKARVGVDFAGPKWSKRKWRFVYNRPSD